MRQHLLKSALVFSVSLACVLPVQAAKEMFYRCKPHANVSTVQMITDSGETHTAVFESDIIVSSKGHGWGYLRLDFLDGKVASYTVIAGQIAFDDLRGVSRVWVLLRSTTNPLGFAVASIRPEAEDCLIYDILGPDVHDGVVEFEVPGDITEVTRPKRSQLDAFRDSG